MLTQLPTEVLALIVAGVGREPDNLFRTCRATHCLALDDRALVQWLQQTFGSLGAIPNLTSLRCVAAWEEARILEVVQQLLKNGCKLTDSAQGGSVLYWATERCLPEVLQVLLQATEHTGTIHTTWLNSLLKTAACRGHEGCVRVLLQQGADPNVDGGRPLKATIEAACHVGCMRALLDAGADLHAGAECALRMCAAAGSPSHLQAMALLLERGADVHAKMDEALSLAVERCNASAVELLLSHGANANARHVLEIASSTGSARIVQLLLAHGASPDADGGRPLRAAAGAGAVDVVRLLLDASFGARRPSSGQEAQQQPGCSSTSSAVSTSAWQLSRNSFDCTSGSRVQHAPHLATSLPTQKVCLTAVAARQRSGVCASHSSSSLASARSSSSSDLQTAGGVDGDSGGLLFEGDMLHLQDEDAPTCSTGTCLHPTHSQLTPELQPGHSSASAGDGRGGMGSEALCAALCAGEDKVVSVLLERGACVDVEVLTCWRLWHRYPGSMALLQRHRLLCTPPQVPHHHACAAVSSYPPTTQQDSYPRALKQKLEEVLIAAACEGAEGAVELFLGWGSPQTQESLAACGRLPAAAFATAAIAQASGMATQEASSTSGCGSLDAVSLEQVLGLFSAKALAAALTAAAALNRHVVCGQLLRHQVGPAWRQALMDPSALHAAVTAGHLDVARLLLQSGAGPITLQAATHSHPQAAATPAFSTTSSSSAASSARPPVLPGRSCTTLPPYDLIMGSATRSTRPAAPPPPPVPSASGTSILAAVNSRLNSTPGSSNPPGQVCLRYSLPPPPLQAEAWGTVVLCGAASCKAGCKAATALTHLLLEHGFGMYARDALRLVASGRVPPWRDDAAATVLSAAFSLL